MTSASNAVISPKMERIYTHNGRKAFEINGPSQDGEDV